MLRRLATGHPPSGPPAPSGSDEFLDDLLPEAQRVVRRPTDRDRGWMPGRPVRRRGDVFKDFLNRPTDSNCRRYARHAISRRKDRCGKPSTCAGGDRMRRRAGRPVRLNAPTSRRSHRLSRRPA
jgi:hypothetical protein